MNNMTFESLIKYNYFILSLVRKEKIDIIESNRFENLKINF